MTNPSSGYKDSESNSHRTFFTLLGVPWKLTPKSWLLIPTRMGICMLLALLLLQSESIGARIFFGVIYALLLLSSQVLHIVGHTLGGKYVAAPMEANLILDTKILTHYQNDPVGLPSRVHLGRALGGPFANLFVGFIAGVAWALIGGHVLLFFVLINFTLGLGVLLPFRGVDGEVIWRELHR